MKKIPLLILLDTHQNIEVDKDYYLHICGIAESDCDYLIDTMHLYKKEDSILYFRSSLEYKDNLALTLMTANKVSFDKRYFELLDDYDTVLTEYNSVLIIPFLEQI